MAIKIWTGADGDGDWENASNWIGGAPANGDDVHIENTSQSILDNLDQSALSLASLIVAKSFTGVIGQRGQYLQIGAAAVRIGEYYGVGSAPLGSPRIQLDLGSVATIVEVFDAGMPQNAEDPAVWLKANKNTSLVYVRKGRVGIAPQTGETSTLGGVLVGYVNSLATDAEVQIGRGVALSDLLIKGGRTILLCAVDTVTLEAGALLTEGSGAIGSLSITGGAAVLNSAGTITLLEVSKNGLADFTKSSYARTVATAKLDPDGRIKYDPSVIMMTNHLQPLGAGGNVQYQASAS